MSNPLEVSELNLRRLDEAAAADLSLWRGVRTFKKHGFGEPRVIKTVPFNRAKLERSERGRDRLLEVLEKEGLVCKLRTPDEVLRHRSVSVLEYTGDSLFRYSIDRQKRSNHYLYDDYYRSARFGRRSIAQSKADLINRFYERRHFYDRVDITLLTGFLNTGFMNEAEILLKDLGTVPNDSSLSNMLSQVEGPQVVLPFIYKNYGRVSGVHIMLDITNIGIWSVNLKIDGGESLYQSTLRILPK